LARSVVGESEVVAACQGVRVVRAEHTLAIQQVGTGVIDRLQRLSIKAADHCEEDGMRALTGQAVQTGPGSAAKGGDIPTKPL
jgi:hypothetical protein